MTKHRFEDGKQYGLISCRLENDVKKIVEEKAYAKRMSVSSFLRTLIDREFKKKVKKAA